MSRQLSLMKDWFEEGVEAGWIERYEQELIRFLKKEFGEFSDEIRMSLVFLSLFIKAGHTCLPMDKSPVEWIEILGLDVDGKSHFPTKKIELQILKSSSLVGSEGDMNPLILTDNHVTFRRYFFYEQTVRQWINRIISNKYITDIDGISLRFLHNLFTEEAEGVDWQKVAAALSLIKPFLIISGGPGTGKTTTVAQVLALHQRLSKKRLNIALAAPTGKAAGRMGEALNRELEKLNLSPEELSHFPREAKTVHRLLSGTESKGLLPPIEKKLLHHDLIIIDEASMMDLSLMYRLVNHLSDHTKLILLGDKDQLASVEAGAVFADLCQKEKNGFLPETIQTLKRLGITNELPEDTESDMSDSIVYLTKSYRFDETSGIGRLADLVKSQNQKGEEAASIFNQYSDLNYQAFSYQKEDIQLILEDLKTKVQKCSKIKKYDELLSFWKESIWLMVLRRGLTGSERLNRLIEERLAAERIVQMDAGWYHGRPIMITQNDYNLGIFNGDLGVAMMDEDESIWVYVESGSETRRFKPQRLSHYDPAFFLTVHKSQGSEFDQVNLLLPQADTPILTKELIYTAITRARKEFSLYGDLDLFEQGIKRETLRFTGLKELLYK
ncbi:exodeoxyribonuclease V subunit alpha [Rhodohalobacter sp. 614A]|uniref:exodeoxyribonuclease V subunit alpha n=1 Tax=Rhodohalobacter sp. 614A TaxID=2908649 RepID=UPI001F1E80BE|nr:exodeoxyribonuclease V subunit alpha [Rhodohalobacter sp. 614A]